MPGTLMLFLLLLSLFLAFEALRIYNVFSRIQIRLWMRNRKTPINAQKSTLQNAVPYEFPPLKVKTSTRMAMGLKRLEDSNWLTIDENYLPEHALRQHLLTTTRPNVIQCLQPSLIACHEALDAAVSFLTSRFPSLYTIYPTPAGPAIHNHATGETFPIGSQCPNPLEVSALLAMEDFSILMKDPDTGDYLLQASATLFPAGWKLQERIGTSMSNLHGPVPGWTEKLGAHVNRYDLSSIQNAGHL